jgi:hypothetical protein
MDHKTDIWSLDSPIFIDDDFPPAEITNIPVSFSRYASNFSSFQLWSGADRVFNPDVIDSPVENRSANKSCLRYLEAFVMVILLQRKLKILNETVT